MALFLSSACLLVGCPELDPPAVDATKEVNADSATPADTSRGIDAPAPDTYTPGDTGGADTAAGEDTDTAPPDAPVASDIDAR